MLKPKPYRVPLEPSRYTLFQFNSKSTDYFLVLTEARKNSYYYYGVAVHYKSWVSKDHTGEGTLKLITILDWKNLDPTTKIELKKQNPELYMQFESHYLWLHQTTLSIAY